MSRKLRKWEKASDDLEAYQKEAGLKPGDPETVRYRYLYAEVSDAYDRLPARHRDPRDQED